MSDVFISYAAEDRERARTLARALEARGWSVWWDRRIVAGQAFDQMIEQALEAARSVVVLWSKDSIVSEWVRNEAAVASERKVLVPALIDDVKVPLEFRRRQTANLIDWDGDTSHEGFAALSEGILAKTGTPTARPEPDPGPDTRQTRFKWRHSWTAAAIAVVAAAVILFAGPRAYRKWTTPSRAVVNVSSSTRNGLDNPAPLRLGVLHKVVLEQNEEYYFQLPSPANALKLVQDMRVRGNRATNLQSILDALDEDGITVQQSVIRFNVIDNGHRLTASFSVKRPSRYRFKLLNENETVEVWLAALPEDASRFLPFFGEVVPQRLSPGQEASGLLDAVEDVYYMSRLAPGDYRVILDLANAKGRNTNIQGYLALLDADGGNQRTLINFNSIGVTDRKIGTFTVRQDGPVILRIQNQNGSVKFVLKLAPDQQ